MADGVVEITPSTDATLKKVDNEFLTVGANSVYRQRIAVPDGADVAQGAVADAAWSGSGSSSVIAALKAIYAKLAGTLDVSDRAGRLLGVVSAPVAAPVAVRQSDGAAFIDPRG